MGQTIKRYVSAIISLDQREINPNIVDVENNYGICDVMNVFGRQKSSKMYKVESFVNEPLWKEGVVGGVVTGSGTPSISFPLSLATSPKRRKNDTIMLPDGKNADVTNVVYAGDPDSTVATITAVSVDGTNLTLADTNTVKFFSNSVGEGHISRDSIFYGTTHYYQLLQSFRETHSISDVQKLSKVEAPTGEWTRKEYVEKFLKLKAEVNAAHLAGQISVSQFSSATNALTDPDGGGIKQFERGLMQYIKTYGVYDSSVAAVGAPTLTGDIGGFTDLLIAKKAQNKYKIWSASAPLRKFDDHLKGLGSSKVESARMSMDGRTIDFEVDQIKHGGFVYQMSMLPILNQPDLFGNTEYDNGFFFIPEGRVHTLNAEGEGSYQPRIQIRFKPQPKVLANKGSDVWAENHSGMYSDIHSQGEKAEANVNWFTSQCIEVLGAQHFGYLGKVARA